MKTPRLESDLFFIQPIIESCESIVKLVKFTLSSNGSIDLIYKPATPDIFKLFAVTLFKIELPVTFKELE